MSDKDFVDQLRDKQVYEDAPKKRWGSYSNTEVETYIEKLNEKIKQTEKVFREQNEDLKRSLKAVARERDELLRRGNVVVPEEIGDNQMADLERLLMKRGMLIIPQAVFESLQHTDAEQTEKAKHMEDALGQIKEKHQAFINAHQELQGAFKTLTEKNPADQNLEKIEAHYLSTIRKQRDELANLKASLAEALTQLKDIIES